jgi:hypothetical protein
MSLRAKDEDDPDMDLHYSRYIEDPEERRRRLAREEAAAASERILHPQLEHVYGELMSTLSAAKYNVHSDYTLQKMARSDRSLIRHMRQDLQKYYQLLNENITSIGAKRANVLKALGLLERFGHICKAHHEGY